jgi:phosphoglycerol transferase MdoB-like AlkP superfamily enzyme
MFSRILFLLKYWSLWVLSFSIGRLVFLLFTRKEASLASYDEFAGSMLHGIVMDISTAAYFTLPVLLFILIGIFIRYFNNRLLYKIYTAIVLFVVLLIILADINAFKAWGNRIDASILRYLKHPAEAWASVANLPVGWLILLLLLCYIIFVLAWNRFISKHFFRIDAGVVKWSQVLLLLLLAGISVIPLRGGFQLAPLNQSTVYFSNNNYANQAALNPVWNFISTLLRRSKETSNPYKFLQPDDANRIVDSLYRSASFRNDNTASHPNVILIIWESFTGKAVDLIHDGIEVTPGFNQLKREGIYFSNIYATGDRTDKGIVGILSGYPAQPTSSIVKDPGKSAKLPMLNSAFKKEGYYNSFYYGGELEFANIKSYLINGGFDKMIYVKDFDKKDMNSKWGAHDGVVMERFFNDISKHTQPFFTTWLTLSSHEPFETPDPPVITGSASEAAFLNSLHYTDKVITALIEKCKQQSWWKSTIVVIVADHGHRLPSTSNTTANFHIPLLMLGGNIRSQTISRVGSQLDLPATLLAQIGKPATQFPWSRNLFDTGFIPFAHFTFNNGFGFVQPSKQYVYDNVGQRLIEKQGAVTTGDIITGRAFLQKSYQDFLDK